MSLYRRILIPIDSSQTAELGLDEAMRLAPALPTPSGGSS